MEEKFKAYVGAETSTHETQYCKLLFHSQMTQYCQSKFICQLKTVLKHQVHLSGRARDQSNLPAWVSYQFLYKRTQETDILPFLCVINFMLLPYSSKFCFSTQVQRWHLTYLFKKYLSNTILIAKMSKIWVFIHGTKGPTD